MTINENIYEYGDKPGSMWQLSYYQDIKEDDKQQFIDRQTRELGGTFNPPPGLSPAEYSSLFSSHFLKSRNDSRNMIEKAENTTTKITEVFQVGNLECIDSINKIESSPDFVNWENPGLVEYFKFISK